MKKILVYGSLREGMYNYDFFHRMFGIAKEFTDVIKGFELYSLGAYPGIKQTDNLDDEVIVDCLHLSPNAYRQIRAMELGANYTEILYTLNGEKYPLYLYNGEVQDDDKVISGDWVKFIQKQEELC